MAEKPDNKEIVTAEESLMSTVIQSGALINLLNKKVLSVNRTCGKK